MDTEARLPAADSTSVVGIAEAIRNRRVTARTVVENSLACIARLNPQLLAMDVVLATQALADADAVDSALDSGRACGLLAGVPVAIKAENDISGVVTTFGGRAGGSAATADCEVVRRLRDAGAIVIGTTHMPEFGQFPFTEGAAWGATRNPWNHARSTGGSSGGSAAAVASGMVPMAIGGDGGGSIRIPAACCGLVGLKPARGRVSTAPHPDLWGALGTIGPLTRTVTDAALVLEVIAGSVSPDRRPALAQSETCTTAVQREPRRLRIGWLVAPSLPWLRIPSWLRRTVVSLARALSDAGHDVRQVPGRWPDARAAFIPQFYSAIRKEVDRVEHPERLEVRTRSTARVGIWVTPRTLARAEEAGEHLRADVEGRFADYDVVLSPTISCLPPTLGQLDAVGSFRALWRSIPMTAFTTLANVTGHPALSLPGGQVSGLPIGVQLYAPGSDEMLLLRLAAQIERLRPWPPLATSLR